MKNLKKIRIEIRNNFLDRPNDTRAFFHVFVHLFVLGILFFATVYFLKKSNPLFLLFGFLYFQVYHFLGMAGLSHELLHNNVFSKKSYNQTLYKALSILSWNNAEYFLVTHWEHHKYTLGEKDPKDLFKGKLSIVRLLNWLIFDFQSLYRRMYYFVLNSRGIVPGLNKSKIRHVQLFSIWTLSFHFFILLYALQTEEYLLIFMINLAPFCFTFLNKVLAVSQHYGLENLDSNVFDNYLENTRSLKLNVITSFFYANMNYHVEHHAFPAVPFYNLPAVQKIILKEEDSNYVWTFIAFFRDFINVK